MLKLNYYSLDGKLESKDSLVARVWYRDKAYPFKPYMLGVSCLSSRSWISLAEL
jgi:hypothetical protein